jgi:signal transduction histidine kinase
MTSQREAIGPGPENQAGTADPSGNVEQAHRRLDQLYSISKLFASFENVEQTFDPTLNIIAKTLPVRSAILIETHESRSQMLVWHSQGESPDHIRAIKQHAEEAFKYLIGVAPTKTLDLTVRPGMTTLPWQPETEGSLTNRLMAIPLVVAHGPPFGVLQLEGARQLDKADLMFVNAIANQLAIAIDRDRAWRRDITRRQNAEEGRAHAEVRGDRAERERTVAQSSSEQYEALAAENARLYQQAHRAVGVREQILAVVSHDLRNPLGAILMTIDGLERTPSEERIERLPHAAARIRRAAERMLRLVDDLLDVASIEFGRLTMKSQANDAGPMLHETLASFESVAKEKRLRLTAEVDPNLPKAYCDRDRILQVLSNLVNNATKVVATGGVVTLRVEAQERELLFSVSDDGPGISQEDFKHLFENYWRSGQVQYKGMGLGLAIAKGIVDAHGGRIWPESTYGLGAKFFFTVPRIDAVDVPAGA